MLKYRFFGLITFLMLAWACANQTTPTGGPKDETPPILLRSTPLNKQKNFHGKEIELVFDEMINLNNPKDEILISPALNQEIVFIAKKNTVIISPQKGWEENTTYSISFREGIRDITESNAPQNLKLAFSTGPLIDSMVVNGKVKMALTTSIPEKITVALYQADTFNIFNHTPNYFTIIDKKGGFSIENIKSGSYYIYAFQDNNKNLKVESRTEKFAFLNEKIQLLGPIDSLTLPLINLDMNPLVLNNVRNTGILTQIKFNKNIINYNIKVESDEQLPNSYGSDQTEIFFYNPEFLKDSLMFELTAVDSIGSQIDTAFFVKPINSNSILSDFTVSSSPITYNLKTSEVTQEFKFSKPIQYINYDSLFIKPDSISKMHITPIDVLYDTISKKLRLKKFIHPDSLFKKPSTVVKVTENKTDTTKKKELLKTKEKGTLPPSRTSNRPVQTEPELILAKGSIISQEMDTLKALRFTISEINKENTGTLLIEVNSQKQFYIIQLISNGEIIQETRNQKKYTFEYLQARSYSIRVIVDANNNGKWDPGNIFKREEPETVYFYQTPDKKYEFPIRANWELGPLMLIF